MVTESFNTTLFLHPKNRANVQIMEQDYKEQWFDKYSTNNKNNVLFTLVDENRLCINNSFYDNELKYVRFEWFEMVELMIKNLFSAFCSGIGRNYHDVDMLIKETIKHRDVLMVSFQREDYICPKNYSINLNRIRGLGDISKLTDLSFKHFILTNE